MLAAILRVEFGFQGALDACSIAIAEAHQLRLDGVRESCYAPKLERIAIFGFDRRRHVKFASFRGALLRSAKQRSGDEGISGHRLASVIAARAAPSKVAGPPL